MAKKGLSKINKVEIAVFIVALIFFGFYFLGNRENQEIEEKLEEKFSVAVLETNFGNIEISLLSSKATSTVRNFLKLSKEGFYNGTKFHRITNEFIQGGDPYSKGDDILLYGTGGPNYSIIDEINDERFKRGVVAMANLGRPNTGGSQFFIFKASKGDWLEGKHSIFGKVIYGMEVVDKIANMEKTINNIPKIPIIINNIILK